MKFNAYVDGFNLYKGALESRPHYKWLDLPSFCASRRPDMTLATVNYFTARIKARFPEDKAPQRQDAYIRVLANQGVQVVMGQFRKDENWLRLVSGHRSNVIQPELPKAFGLTQGMLNRVVAEAKPDLPKSFVWEYGEKGSDVNLASNLLRDVFQNDLGAALVISGDSDLATPVAMSKEHGVNIKVVVPKQGAPSGALRRAASHIEELHVSELANYQLPNSFITKSGGNIVRPKTWR